MLHLSSDTLHSLLTTHHRLSPVPTLQLGGCTGDNPISEVVFASYGTPTGSCLGTLAVDAACNANSTRAVLEKACLGKTNCSVAATLANFGGDPCPYVNKKLAARVRCANDPPPTPAPPYTSNTFIATTWQGPVQMPVTTDGVRQAAADVLVQSLAPFLIVANEHVFLQYSWFYEMQDGHIPCPPGIECGMPSSWYPEYAKPLGAPKGPAVNDGYVWTREFAHASVYVDARSRAASKITWHTPTE